MFHDFLDSFLKKQKCNVYNLHLNKPRAFERISLSTCYINVVLSLTIDTDIKMKHSKTNFFLLAHEPILIYIFMDKFEKILHSIFVEV